MANFQRSTAKICNVKDLISNKFIKKEGWDPSYVLSEYGKLMRINIIGVIVSKNNNDCTFDDGTGKIIVRNFIDNINAKIGDVVTVIGKPRIFNNEVFVNAEIIKPLKNKKWVEYRKKLLTLRETQEIAKEEENYIDDSKIQEVKEDKQEVIQEHVNENISKAELIIKLIDKLDNGSGASMSEIITKANFEGAEKLIKSLMEEGEIFQIKPGMLKVM